MRQTFFGQNYKYFNLSVGYINNLYEKFYIMKTHMGWSFEEAYILPISLREWFYSKWIEDQGEKD